MTPYETLRLWKDTAARRLWWWDEEEGGTWRQQTADGWVSSSSSSSYPSPRPLTWTPWTTLHETDAEHPVLHRWFVGGRTNLCACELDVPLRETGRDDVCFVEDRDGASSSPGRRVTRLELLEASHRHAVWLRTRGWAVVGLWMPATIATVAWVQACKRAGIVFVPMSLDSSLSSVRRRCEDAGVDALLAFHSQEEAGWTEQKEDGCCPYVQVTEGDAEQARGRAQADGARPGSVAERVAACASSLVPVEANHPLFVMYTSGSTGKPKGIVHTHAGLGVGAALTGTRVLALRPTDVLLVVATPGWITGQVYGLCAPLLHGCTSVLMAGSAVQPHDRVPRVVAAHGVTVLKSASTFARALMTVPGEEEERRLRGLCATLRLGAFCAEPVHPRVHAFARRCLCPRYVNCYWSTEHGGIVCAPLADAPAPLEDGGTRALPWITAHTEDGQLRLGGLRPPHMGRGVWRRGEEWDVARWESYFDSEGRFVQGDAVKGRGDDVFRVLGRADDVVNVGGNRVGLQQIDDAVLARADVLLSASVGVEDTLLGTVVWTFVEDKARAEDADARTRCRLLERRVAESVAADVGSAVVPRRVFSLPSLPMTLTGKLVRTALRAAVQDAPLDVGAVRDPSAVRAARDAVRDASRAAPPLCDGLQGRTSVPMHRLWPLVDGHVVDGRTLVPAALFLELLRPSGDVVRYLRDVHFLQPLYTQEGDTTHLHMHREEGSATIHFVHEGRVVASAQEATEEGQGQGRQGDAKDGRCPLEPGEEDLYARLRKAGLEYEGNFVCLDTSSSLTDDGECGMHHPRAVDAVFQRDLAAFEELHVPSRIASVLLPPFATTHRCPRRVRDGAVWDDAGALFARLRGITYARFRHPPSLSLSSTPSSSSPPQTREALLAAVSEAVSTALRRPLGPEDSLEAAGMDSFAALSIFEAVRRLAPTGEAAPLLHPAIAYERDSVERLVDALLSDSSSSSSSSSPPLAVVPPLRVLCLHGSRSSAAQMRVQMRGLVRRMEPTFEFVFLDGPVVLEDGTRSWFDVQDGRYVGVEEALAHVRERAGECDLAVGFSQGGCVLSMLAHRGQEETNGKEAVPWRMHILVGPIEPADEAWRIPSHSLSVPCLVVVGDADDHRERSMRVAEAHAAPIVLHHAGGHAFPTDDGLLDGIVREAVATVHNELWYYDARGRAELVRLTLAECGLRYRNRTPAAADRKTVALFLDAARRLGGHTTTNIPLLRLGGRVFTQSHAIVRMLQRDHMTPSLSTEWWYRVDMYLGTAEDLRGLLLPYALGTTPVTDLAKLTRDVSRHVANFVDALRGAPYLSGTRLSVADLSWYDVLANFVEALLPGTLPRTAHQFVQRISARPRIRDWLRSDECARMRVFSPLAPRKEEEEAREQRTVSV